MSNDSLPHELDDRKETLLKSIGEQEAIILAACEAIRSDIGSLVGHIVPFEDHGRIHQGQVVGAAGHHRKYRIRIRNLKTGVVREISTYAVLTAHRLAN